MPAPELTAQHPHAAAVGNAVDCTVFPPLAKARSIIGNAEQGNKQTDLCTAGAVVRAGYGRRGPGEAAGVPEHCLRAAARRPVSVCQGGGSP